MTQKQSNTLAPEVPSPVTDKVEDGGPESGINVTGTLETTASLKPAHATKGETEEAKAEREKAVREAYAAAGKRLREENLDRFNELHAEEAAKRGYSWKPRLTKAEKAAQQLELLLAEHPELRERV